MHPAYVQGYAEVMTKMANITEEDIAAALAGRTDRDISPEEVSQYAREQGREGYMGASSHPKWGVGIGGVLGGGLGALGGTIARGKPGVGTAIGAGLGALGGGGLGYLAGKASQKGVGHREKMWGQELGDIAQAGRVPRELAHTYEHGRELENLLPYASGIQEETAKPLTPEEFAMIRSGLMKELMTEKGIEGALSGAAMGGRYEGGEENSRDKLQHQLIGAALEGGQGALKGMREARERAGTLSDLYERGYGHLAGRLYEHK